MPRYSKQTKTAELIDSLGNTCKVGKVLGVKPNRVSNWKTRDKIPEAYFELLKIRFPGHPVWNNVGDAK